MSAYEAAAEIRDPLLRIERSLARIADALDALATTALDSERHQRAWLAERHRHLRAAVDFLAERSLRTEEAVASLQGFEESYADLLAELNTGPAPR